MRALIIYELNMTEEDLRDFRPFSHAEMDNLMEEGRQRRAQYERGERESQGSQRASLDTNLNAESEPAQGVHMVSSAEAESLKQRIRAAMTPKPRAVREEQEPVVAGVPTERGVDRCVGGEESTGDPEVDRLLAEFDSPPSPGSSSSGAVVVAMEPSCSDSAGGGKSELCEPCHVAPTPAVFAPSVVPLPAASLGIDRFPVTGLTDVPEFDSPIREMAALCRELKLHKDYRAVRDRYCQLSIRMNLEGAIAPAFRPRPRGEAPKNHAVHMQLYRDQLVIDYHWCHVRQMSLSPTDPAHAHLLDPESDFDFTAACLLTRKKQKPKFRAGEALCLTPLQQCQTMRLHGVEVEARMASIADGYRTSSGKSHSAMAKVKAAIGQWIEHDPRIETHRISYERLWQARALLGPGAPAQSIAKLHGLMTGEQPLDRKTIADKLKRLEKHLALVLKPSGTS